MSLESIEKLRELAKHWRKISVTPGKNPSADEVDELCDAIEAEVAESYMRLPKDADGMPIHVGDRLKGVFETFEVCAVGEYHGEHCAYWADGKHWDRASSCHHVNPRTIEDVLLGFWNESGKSIEWKELEKRIGEVADEIRELMAE